MPRCWSAPNTKDAYRLSWVSLFASLMAALAGFLMFLSSGSSLALVFGLENCVDLISSAVVVWRFFAPSKINPALEAKLNRREERASVAISLILILLGVIVIGTAGGDFLRGEESHSQLNDVLAVSICSFLIFGTLAGFKFRYAGYLESASLYKDGLCSLVGTILAGTLFINTLIIRENSIYWWIDPLVALLCGVGSLVLGIIHTHHAHCKDGLPIFTLQWWAMSQGQGIDEQPSIGKENKSVVEGDETTSNDAEELEMGESEKEGQVV